MRQSQLYLEDNPEERYKDNIGNDLQEEVEDKEGSYFSN